MNAPSPVQIWPFIDESGPSVIQKVSACEVLFQLTIITHNKCGHRVSLATLRRLHNLEIWNTLSIQCICNYATNIWWTFSGNQWMWRPAEKVFRNEQAWSLVSRLSKHEKWFSAKHYHYPFSILAISISILNGHSPTLAGKQTCWQHIQ